MAVAVQFAGPGDVELVLRAHTDVVDAPPDRALTSRFLAAPHLHLALAIEDGVVICMRPGAITT